MPTALQKNRVNFFTAHPPASFLLPLPKPKPVTNSSFGLAANYNYLRLGWVCQKEWKLEKTTSIPLRVRLGSQEQVDYLEGKNSSHYGNSRQ